MKRCLKSRTYVLVGLIGSFVLITLLFVTNKLEVSTTSSIGSGYTIYLDAGHGEKDGGASSESGVFEKDINLNVTLYLGALLEDAGFNIQYTRTDDTRLTSEGATHKQRSDILNRAKLINESDADFYFTIHCNAIADDRWYGSQVFYNPINEENEGIAKSIQAMLNVSLENSNRKAKAVSNVLLLKEISKPGALVELGFLSNHNEAAKLASDKYQQKLAHSIYLGILEQIGQSI